MHYLQAFLIMYIFNIYLIFNNRAVSLSNVHRKRELNFNNYPGNRPGDRNNYYQQNSINDPGYTTQNENGNDEKASFDESTASITSPQSFVEFINPKVQMFHLMYITPHPNKIQQTPTNEESMTYHTRLNHHTLPVNGNIQNMAYAGPHLFPTQHPNNYQNMQQSNLPIKSFNTALHNIYPAQIFLNNIKDSKVATKMEAPFIPSQFLGYGQYQKQYLPQQQQQKLPQQQQQFAQQYQRIPQQHQQLSQQLPQQSQQQYQQLSQQNQQLSPQYQQSARPPFKMPLNTEIKPVHEQHQVPPYQPNNLIYMAPNNVYDLYRKSN